MKVRNSNAKMNVNMTYGLYAKSWAEEHSNDFSDYNMIDNIIDNDIDFIDCVDENGTIIIFC